MEAKRIEGAFGFIRRWNTLEFSNVRTKLDSLKNNNWNSKELKEYIEESNNLTHIKTVLNFFEEMAIAIRHERADEPTLRSAFESLAVRIFRTLEPWILQHRKDVNPKAWTEYDSVIFNQWRLKK